MLRILLKHQFKSGNTFKMNLISSVLELDQLMHALEVTTLPTLEAMEKSLQMPLLYFTSW